MANVVDVGQYIYDKLGWVDAWRLQKLSYYAQAWSLSWDGDPIFEERFTAWPDGPVSRDLHRENKYYRTGTHIDDADPARLTQRQKEVVDAVLAFYGGMSKDELIDLTHREQPWQEARGDLGPADRSSAELSTSSMRRTYTLQALSMTSVPTAPGTEGHGCLALQDSVLEAEISRWSSTLDWLATR